MDDKFELIKERIAHILRAKNLTATQFAELMQIQPSNVSHILNGRNKPSLDFVTKLKDVFPEYNLDWIIMGRKPITISETGLFSRENSNKMEEKHPIEIDDVVNERSLQLDFNPINITSNQNEIDKNIPSSHKDGLKQIIYVFEDHTFEIFNIRKY